MAPTKAVLLLSAALALPAQAQYMNNMRPGVNFTNAYAANGMATSMAPESMQLAMSENMAHNVTQDPTWAMIGMAIDRELAMRAMPGYDA